MRILYFILLVFVIFSCSKYLEEIPQNQLMPTTTEDYDQLLNKAYISKQVMPFLDMASDDVILKAEDHVMNNSDPGDYMVGAYMWNNTHETTMAGGDIAFSSLYQSIFYTNIVIDNIDNAQGVEMNEANILHVKNNIKGEALALRAYSYFYLVNLYGAPLNSDASEMGVPINLSTSAQDIAYKRNSVEEVYDQILTDLIKGIKLMEDNPIAVKNKFKFNEVSASLLLARAYLYMEKWDKALERAEYVLSNNTSIFNLYAAGDKLNISNNKGTSWSGVSIWGVDYLEKSNENVLFVNGLNELLPAMSFWPFMTTFSINPELAALYTDNDVRRFYFMHTYECSTYAGFRSKLSYAKNRYIPLSFVMSVPNSGSSGYTRTLRTEEAYFIAAEALANLNKIEESLLYLNKVRKEKFRDGKYISLISSDFYSNKELLDFIMLDRRLEFCFEGHRWFDLKRTTRPAMERMGYDNMKASIGENDYRYVFQIPENETDVNPKIGMYPR